MALLTTLLVGFSLLALRRFAMIHIAKHGCCARGCFMALFSAETRLHGMCYTCYMLVSHPDVEVGWERYMAFHASLFGRLKARCQQTHNRFSPHKEGSKVPLFF